MESDRVQVGVERAKVLAQGLECQAAVLVFPGVGDQTEVSSLSGNSAPLTRMSQFD